MKLKKVKELILHEQELIRRCIKGNRHAQEALFNQFYEDLYRIGMRYLSDHHDTEDAIIQAYSRVFKSLHKFNYTGKGSLGKWVRTILINEAIRLLQKRKRIYFEEDATQVQLPELQANGLEQLQASDILRMIEKLPAGYRTVFNLNVVEGYSHKEIGELLGISENTSKTQLKKARHQLMNQLNQDSAYGTI